MVICSIAAMARNRVIGRDNQLPWHIPEDLKFFKDKTMGRAMIMGRKTFESLGKPLPKRTNIVLTRDTSFKPEGVFVFQKIEDALKFIEPKVGRDEEVFIIGGGEVYKQTMSLVQRLYLTMIDLEPQGDAFFPPVDFENEFKITNKREVEGQPSYTFIEAERR